MRLFRKLRLRLRSLVRNRQVERELDEELRFHLERQIEVHLAAGLSRDEARHAALREIGPREARKEECRDARGLTLLDSVLQDVRYAARSIRKSPGFAFVSILSIALGIGANTTIFTFVNAVLLRPLPYPEPDRLVEIREQPLGAQNTVPVHPLNFLEWQRRARSFQALSLSQVVPTNVTGRDGAEQITVAMTTWELFGALGLPLHLGRGFTKQETLPTSRGSSDDPTGFAPSGLLTGQPVVVVGYGYWVRRFGSDPAIVGKTMVVDGRARTIVGVTAPDMALGTIYPDLYEPLPIDPARPDSIGSRSFRCIGRLRPGVTVEAAQAEMTTIAKDLSARYELDRHFGVAVFGLHQYLVREGRPALRILMGVVATVLVIACVNLAGLLMARGIGRRSELALRASLGASRSRLVRQLLIESLVLSALGGAAGLLLAVGATRALVALTEGALTLGRTEPIGIDGICLAFTIALSTLTALLFGLFPAWQVSRVDPQRALGEHGRSATADRRHERWRSGLVVAEVALAIVLLVGAGLLLRTFASLARIELGFQPESRLAMSLFLGTGDPASRARLVEAIIDRVEALPGVRAAGTIQFMPLAGLNCGTGLWLDPKSPRDGAHAVFTECSLISRGYFAAMGIPVLEGRAFDRRDRLDSPRVLIVNQTLVERYFPDGRALGRHIVLDWTNPAPAEIVGVVRDIRHSALTSEPAPTVFLPHAQAPGYITNLVVSTAGNPAAQTTAIRQAIQQVDPMQAVSNVKTLEQYVDAALARPRLYAALVTAFALLAIVLAAIGVYGLIAYVVGQRTREIGIRLALGAERRTIFSGVFRQGAVLLAIGMAAGVAAALSLQRLMASLLYDVTATDPLTYTTAGALFAAVVLAAAAVPAWRASRVDPTTALR